MTVKERSSMETGIKSGRKRAVVNVANILAMQPRLLGMHFCSRCRERVAWFYHPRTEEVACEQGHGERFKLTRGEMAWKCADPIIDPNTGEVLAERGEVVNQDFINWINKFGFIYYVESYRLGDLDEEN